MRAKRIDQYAKVQTTICTQLTLKSQESSRESENTNIILKEHSLDYLCWTVKGQDKTNEESVRIQSALCEVACEQNSCG